MPLAIPLTIDLQDLVTFSLRGAALVAGPSLTSHSTAKDECLKTLRARFPDCTPKLPIESYYDFADCAAQNGKSLVSIRGCIEKHFQTVRPSPQLRSIVKVAWKAIISLSEDNHLKNQLTLYLDDIPASISVTGIAHAKVVPEPRTIPIYELLGDLRDARQQACLAVTNPEFLERRRSWRELLSTAPDFIKGGLLIFAGTSSDVDLVIEFLNESFALKPGLSNKLIFLNDDPASFNPAVLQLVGDRCSIFRVQCNLSEACQAFEDCRQTVSIKQIPLELNDLPFDPRPLQSIADQVSRVPFKQEIPASQEGEKSRLLDILFSPSHLGWSPFKEALDFPREMASVLHQHIAGWFSKHIQTAERFIGIRGESGVGKTTTLRRVAFDLAQENYLCLWVKKSYGELSGGRFDAVVQSVERCLEGKKTKVVFFYDDPLSGNVGIQELYNALSHARFEWLCVLCVRNSDLANSRLERTEPFTDDKAIVFSSSLTEQEFGNFPRT